MSFSKVRWYKYARFTFTALFICAFLVSPLSNVIKTAAASSDAEPAVTPGLRAAIQETLGPDAFAPVEDAKLTASDGAAEDLFGGHVALSGDTALVGAPGFGNSDVSGYAYIFERDQGGADNWGQVKKLTPSDGAANDHFGLSVALSGDTALVGAWGDDDSGDASGSAYLFERDQGGAGNWGQVKKLTASDAAAFDMFGHAVALSGDTALVGAWGNSDNGDASGSAYIFERDQGGVDNWGEVKKLIASDAAFFDHFGWTVALNGDTALVGASNDDSQKGAAYLFERDLGGAGNWGEAAKLTASDAANFDSFGWSVALSGDTALVGAIGDDDNGSMSGSAYLFERNLGGAGNWGEAAKLTASDAAAGDEFGYAVALNSAAALVGAIDDDDNGEDSGSATLFKQDQGGADNWGQAAKLTAFDGAANDHFGVSVALTGDTALVGSPWDDDDGDGSGSAYVYSSRYLVNGGFEDPLGSEWDEVVTGNGDGRVPLKHAYSGSYIYLFNADGGLEVIKQTLDQSGIAGDEYTLTLYFGGQNVDLSGKLGARLIFKNGGVKVDKKTCIFTPPSSSFSWTQFTCTLTATGAFDSIEVLIGIQNVPSGMVGVDAAILNKTGP